MPNLAALVSRKWDESDAGKTGHTRTLDIIKYFVIPGLGLSP